jgi:hypothetical protein
MDHARGGTLGTVAGYWLTCATADGTDKHGVGNLGVNTIGRPGDHS